MKKRMFLTTALMALVLLVAVTTATFAWYTVTSGAAVGEVNTHDMSTTTSISLGDLVMDVTVTANQIELSATDGYTYAWALDGKTKIKRAITVETLGKYYSAVTVTVDKVYLKDDVDKKPLDADTLKDYAGSYTFYVTSDEDAYLASSAPSTVEALNAINARSAVFEVVISSTGSVSTTAASKVFAVVRGDDAHKTGGETGTLNVVATIS